SRLDDVDHQACLDEDGYEQKSHANLRDLTSWRRQRKRDDIVAARRLEAAVPAGRNDDELPLVTARTIGHRCRLSPGGEMIFPQLTPGLDVERAEVTVHRGPDEDQVARGPDGTTHIRHPKVPR